MANANPRHPVQKEHKESKKSTSNDSWFDVTEKEQQKTATAGKSTGAAATNDGVPKPVIPIDYSKDDDEKKTSVLKTKRGRKALLEFGKHAKLGIGGTGKTPRVLSLPICYVYPLQTTTGGVLQQKFGGALLNSHAEFTDLNGIFELCRVAGFRVWYQPYSFGALLDDAAAGHDLFHRPQIFVLDPDIPVSLTNSYATLSATVIPSDPNVKLGNTSQPINKKAFKGPPNSFQGVSGSSGTLSITIFDWQAPASIATSVGGLSWAAATDAAAGTNGLNGELWVEYLTEWKFRQ